MADTRTRPAGPAVANYARGCRSDRFLQASSSRIDSGGGDFSSDVKFEKQELSVDTATSQAQRPIETKQLFSSLK